jgi:putative PIN family toxin of toxin-antitoxin system
MLRHTVVTSEYILEELTDKLTTKFHFSHREAAVLRRTLLEQMLLVFPDALPLRVCRDPDDDNILAAAIAGDCDCIVTGDKDLLVLKEYRGIPILTPRTFMDWEK